MIGGFMYKRMGDLEVGDVIVGSNGEKVVVTEAYDPHIPEKMYEITLENDEVVQASGNHLWYVESSFDRSYHAERRRVGRKALKGIPAPALEDLITIAESDEEIETMLVDMVALCQFDESDSNLVGVVRRVAESLGHIAENNSEYQDLYTDEVIHLSNTVRSYDAKQFCQQILSLRGDHKHRKRWPLIVGRVVTTEQLVWSYTDVDIPTIRKID